MWNPVKRWHVPDRPPAPVNRWEDVDTMGDNVRVSMVWPNVVVFTLAVVACVVLLVVGDSRVRALALMGLIFGLGVLIPTASGLRNTLWRMRNGRGLVPGDPYRAKEGVDPAEASPGGHDDG